MDVLKLAIDVFGMVFALGMSSYAFLLSKALKGGMLEKPFRILALSPLVFVLGELVDSFEATSETLIVIHDVFEVAFVAVVFLGILSIYTVWKRWQLGT
jgi:hypothetical protein